VTGRSWILGRRNCEGMREGPTAEEAASAEAFFTAMRPAVRDLG